MRTISVINYKGGVGKTTVTANLGANLAFRGRSVLLIDADPQASLTFSFFRPEFWSSQLAGSRTIKQWFDALLTHRSTQLADLVVSPPGIEERVAGLGGRLDLVASHLSLIDVDAELASSLGGGLAPERVRENYLRVHTSLADGIRTSLAASYDYVLIDCAPNFGTVTKTAVVASTHILVPAKADSLSTLGIDYLTQRVEELTRTYNGFVSMGSGEHGGYQDISPVILGVVFTMVGLRDGLPYAALHAAIDEVRQKFPVFDAMVRESKSAFADAVLATLPVVFAESGGDTAVEDLERLTDEFLWRIEGSQHE